MSLFSHGNLVHPLSLYKTHLTLVFLSRHQTHKSYISPSLSLSLSFSLILPLTVNMKESQLNGAYYGPAIPPQRTQRTYRSVGRSSGCGPCCLLCNLIKFIISIVIILGIIVLVLWLVLRPNAIKVHATSASLTQFSLSNGSLQYNLNVNMSIRNPNRRIGLYYDYIEASSYYDGSRFGFDNSLEPFYQGHKNTSYIDTKFNGQNALVSDSVASTYSKEKNDGYYNIELKVRPKLRLKIWIFKIKHIKPKINCDLKLPVPGTSGSFSETKCDVDF